jgi:D-inositol-3-phosphate glycosyltransferase
MTKPKCLFVGDGCVATGFARMNHAYIAGIQDTWDVSMIALNHHGDPHSYPYDIYPPYNRLHGGDSPWGVARVPELIAKTRPDMMVLVNDPWNLPMYMKVAGNTPIIASVAVDGLNCRGNMMNGLRHAIFWTRFGEVQARLGGYTGPASIVPLGVDLSVYHPTEQAEARRRIGLPAQLRDGAFIVGVVGRNQPRKRIDLAMIYFAEWIKSTGNLDAYLFLHVGPTGDRGYDVEQLAQYLQISNRVIVSQPEIGQGMAEEHLKYVYGSFDAMLSTTQGEGWGLTHLEGMACGVPQILPRWSALGEWAVGAAHLVECSAVSCTPNNINVVGGIPDKDETVMALERVYSEYSYRTQLKDAGIALARLPQYRWESIGQQFAEILESCMSPVILQEQVG